LLLLCFIFMFDVCAKSEKQSSIVSSGVTPANIRDSPYSKTASTGLARPFTTIMAAVVETHQPTDAEIKCQIEELVPQIDVNELRVKQFLQLLSKRMGNVNLQPRKAFIKSTLADAINQHQQKAAATAAAAAGDSGDDDDDDDDDDDESEVAEEEEQEDDDDESSVEAAPIKKKGRGGGGLSAKKEISTELANFLGQGPQMARTDIVKSLWVYIREHELQNPANKKEIILDKAMRKVFGCKTFTMFSMNKYIGAHVHPFKPVDLTTPSASAVAAKKRKAAASKNSGAKKKKRKAGTQPPYRLSDALQQVVHEAVLPRPQVVKKIWEYIRSHGLQNPQDKREILCDEKLKRVMGGKQSVTMFNMNTHISAHLIEKADRSEYTADDDDDGDDDDE
jgi:upstream activation factor subunit UAF30